MLLTDICKAISPEKVHGLSSPSANVDIAYLMTDSRQGTKDASKTLFFGIKTNHDDGARYIEDVYKRGVRSFVVSTSSEVSIIHPDAVYLYVKDVIGAMQDVAAYKRSLYHCPVIAITGSNGKTVVKEWLYQLLKDDYRITRSPKSYNSQIGVPLSVWMMDENTEMGIFEAGISAPGEMDRLARVIKPTLGVVTYIGEEHGENFASIEDKRAEKMRLFANGCPVIEDATHQNVRTCAAVMRALGYDEDTIAARILHQTHETVLEVNTDALISNVRYFRSLIRPTTRLTCMVKAFAYGMGSVDISLALQSAQDADGRALVDYLAVAVADEGVELRRAGVTLPIITMDPEPAAMDLILENNLEPNVYSFQSLDNVIEAATRKGLEDYSIHIKIDSGMHRLGFYQTDMTELTNRLGAQRTVRVVSVFSHLAGADEPQWDAFTLGQIRYFQACAEQLQAGLTYPIWRHILNTAGMERFTQYQMEMCRLGIGMYGFSFNQVKLPQVCTLKTTILSVKTVPAGETIGYGRHTTLATARQIAVIPIGYADGFDRRFSNYGGKVIVRGHRCPVVGNVCMDQAMVDVTGTDAQAGDYAFIFSDALPISELADSLHTIPYEILTSVSRRVQRVYTSQ